MITKTTKNTDKKPAEKKKQTSGMEEAFAQYLIFKNITFKRQFTPIPNRKFRCDFYIQKYNLVIEIQGGIFSGGRHTRGMGYSDDCKRENILTLAGYRILKLTTEHFLRTGKDEYMVSGYSKQLVDDILDVFESTEDRTVNVINSKSRSKSIPD
jgi:very-short-patch-repair endonuclease